MSFRSASKQALHSEHQQHRLGCVIVKGGRVLSTGFNQFRYTKELEKPTLHAEQDALLKLIKAKRLSAIVGSDLYVMRYTAGGRIGLARPCHHCETLIRTLGVRNVYFTKDDGTTGHYKAC